jgi:hypothetical protein
MKEVGVNNNLTFLLTETSPILQIKKGEVDESGKKLVKGTVIEGMLKTRVVNVKGQKTPYRFIQLKDKAGYISPQVVNLYIGNFANLDGNNQKKETDPVKGTAYGQKSGKKKKLKNAIINYGVPVLGGFVGYKIAKKMGADTKKTVGFVLFFGLLGCIPRYMYKNK